MVLKGHFKLIGVTEIGLWTTNVVVRLLTSVCLACLDSVTY